MIEDLGRAYVEGAAVLAAVAAVLLVARAAVRRAVAADRSDRIEEPDPELTIEDLEAELLDELRDDPGPRTQQLVYRLARRHGIEPRAVADVLRGLRASGRVRAGRGLRLFAVEPTP